MDHRRIVEPDSFDIILAHKMAEAECLYSRLTDEIVSAPDHIAEYFEPEMENLDGFLERARKVRSKLGEKYNEANV